MNKLLTLYHGSEKIIKTPIWGQGRENNDFGRGFYCTASEELAKEWAVSSLKDGFANRYTIDTAYMNILRLNSEEYNILNWIAILVGHRLFAIKTPIARRAREYLIENFALNVNAYDVVVGYRADDSYFDYAETFINNGISVGDLAKAMKLGQLGEQIVLKSQYAFSQLKYEGFSTASREQYYVKRKARNDQANKSYWELLEKADEGLYIQDIIRGGVKNNDPRIPRNISD